MHIREQGEGVSYPMVLKYHAAFLNSNFTIYTETENTHTAENKVARVRKSKKKSIHNFSVSL